MGDFFRASPDPNQELPISSFPFNRTPPIERLPLPIPPLPGTLPGTLPELQPGADTLLNQLLIEEMKRRGAELPLPGSLKKPDWLLR